MVVGSDVGKRWVGAVVHCEDGQWKRPWSVENRGEIRGLVELLERVAGERRLRLAMEPTGTYGKVLRHALWDAGLGDFERVPARALDGVLTIGLPKRAPHLGLLIWPGRGHFCRPPGLASPSGPYVRTTAAHAGEKTQSIQPPPSTRSPA